MNIAKKTTSLALASAFGLGLSVATYAQEEPGQPQFVCNADQVLPALGFLPITFSRDVASLLGVDPDECQTPVEDF